MILLVGTARSHHNAGSRRDAQAGQLCCHVDGVYLVATTDLRRKLFGICLQW